MSTNPSSSDLHLIWYTYRDFEAFSREKDDDLNHFIEEWKKKMAKVQLTGCQYSDLLLGLKLMESVNLSHDSVLSVISNLGSSTSSYENFLTEVVTKIKDQSNSRGSIGNQSTHETRISDYNQEFAVDGENKSNILSNSVKYLEEENFSKPFLELHPDVFRDRSVALENGSKSDSVFLKCPICNKNFMLIDNLNKHIKNHENGLSGFDEDSSFGQEWMDSLEIENENQNVEDLQYKIKKEVINETIEKYDKKKAAVNASKSTKRSKNDGGFKKPIPRDHLSRVPCEICGKYFAKCGFAQHMQSHTTKSLDFSCSQCDRTYKDDIMLKRHVSQMHTTPLIPCEICGRPFAKCSIKQHMQSHNSKTLDFNCTQCEKTYKDSSMLKRHVSQVHNMPLLPCEICGKSFTKSGFNQHVQSHNAKTIGCSQCDKKFKDDSMLRRHISQSHTKIDGNSVEDPYAKKPNGPYTKYPCELCGKPIAENCMATHLKSHSTVADLQCDQCPKKCKKMSSLKKHMETHKQNKPAKKLIECSICHKQYGHLTFKVHLKSHRTTRDYICSYCGKGYKTRMSLSAHINVHTKAKQFPCQMCEKVCYSGNSLKFHVRAHHTGEKPFKCDICEKRFYTSSKKKEHMSIHSGAKPFPCHICGKYFRLYCTRRRHIRTVHKEVKPFAI